jgi:hypothetical protein
MCWNRKVNASLKSISLAAEILLVRRLIMASPIGSEDSDEFIETALIKSRMR